MENREWYEKRLPGHSSNQQDIIRLLLDIRDLVAQKRVKEETVMTVKFGRVLSESDKKEWCEVIESSKFEPYVDVEFVKKLKIVKK